MNKQVKICSCIKHLLALQSFADKEASRLRERFHIHAFPASWSSTMAAERLIAKLEYDVSYLDSIIRSIRLDRKMAEEQKEECRIKGAV